MKRVFLPFLLMLTAGFGFNTTIPTQDVPSRLIPATVEISVKEKKDDSFSHAGTGWLYSDQMTIITAKHVTDGFDETVTKPDKSETIKHMPYAEIRITFNDGQQVVVAHIKESKTYDVAVLSLGSKNLKTTRNPLTLANSREIIGDKLFGAGYPLDYECLLFTGYVTGYHKVAEGQFKGEYMVTNATFNPGNSGGPIVNEKGEVIGMVDWVDRRSPVLNFALTPDVIASAISE